MPKLKEFQMRKFFFEGFSSFFYCVSVLFFLFWIQILKITNSPLRTWSAIREKYFFYLLPSGIHAGYFPEATWPHETTANPTWICNKLFLITSIETYRDLWKYIYAYFEHTVRYKRVEAQKLWLNHLLHVLAATAGITSL
jgi:hypothetical protein